MYPIEHKNIVMKWGIYPIEDETISVEQMWDRALLAARSIGGGQYGKYFAIYDDELRARGFTNRRSPILWNRHPEEETIRNTCSLNTGVRDERTGGRRHWCDGIIHLWGFQSPLNLFHCLKKWLYNKAGSICRGDKNLLYPKRMGGQGDPRRLPFL